MTIILLTILSIVAPLPSVAEVEQLAVNARQRIQKMHIRFRVQHEYPEQPDHNMIGVRTVWLDGSKIRGEIIREKGPNPGHRFVSCYNCERDGYGITWADLPQLAATMNRLNEAGKPKCDDSIDPRQLGFLPIVSDALRPWQTRLNAYIGATDHTNATISQTTLNGVDCWLLGWNIRDTKLAVKVWVAPTKGYSVLRLQVEEPQKFLKLVDSEVELHIPSGIWFPSKIVYQDFGNKTLRGKEIIEVETISINEHIDPSIFTLAGLNFPDGTYIAMPEASKSGVWRNGELQARDASVLFQDTTPPVPVNPPAKVDYWLVAVCGIFVVAAIAVIVFRKKQATS